MAWKLVFVVVLVLWSFVGLYLDTTALDWLIPIPVTYSQLLTARFSLLAKRVWKKNISNTPTDTRDKTQFSIYPLTVLTFAAAKYTTVHIDSTEIHSTRCWKNKKSPKSLSATCSSFRLPETRKHRVSRAWSGLIQSLANPPCSGGQGHPNATSTCQRRLAGEGLWWDAGDRLKGATNRDLGCQSAGRQGIVHIGEPNYAPTQWGSNKCSLLFSATSNTPASPWLESQSSADTNSVLAFMCCRLQALHQAINGGGLGVEWALRPLSTEPEELRQRKSTPTSEPFCTLSGELPHYFLSVWFRLRTCIFFSRSRAFNSHQAVPSHYSIILNGFASSLLCKALNCVLNVVANVKFTVIQIAPLLKQLSKLEFMNIRGNISFHLCRYLTA